MFTIWNKPILDVHKYAASVENDPLCQVFQTKQYIEHDLSGIVHVNTVHKLVLEYSVSSIYSHMYKVFFSFFSGGKGVHYQLQFFYYHPIIALLASPQSLDLEELKVDVCILDSERISYCVIQSFFRRNQILSFYTLMYIPLTCGTVPK